MDPQHLGYYWGLVSLSGNVGASVAPIAMALICDYSEESAEGTGWQAIFVVGGSVAILISVGVNLLLQLQTTEAPPARNTPAQVKDTQLTRSAAKNASITSPAAGPQASVNALAVLSRPTIWLMMLVNMIIYLPLKACQEWGVIIAIQQFGMTPTVGSSLVTWHELGGVLSGFVAPVLSDFCGGRRTVVCTPLNMC